MKEKLQSIREEALKQIHSADMPEKLNDVRVRFLGKKGELTAVLKGMKDVAAEERPKVGQMVNEVRQEIESILDETKKKMDEKIREEKLKAEVIDVTLPSKKNVVGHRHPNTRESSWEWDMKSSRDRKLSTTCIILKNSIFRQIIRQRMNRIRSILTRISSSEPRPPRYRPVSWNRVNFRFV